MGETSDSKPGPAIGSRIDEVQALFPSDATLQDALSRLTLAGYDRADFSLPETEPAAGHATPDQGAENPNTDVDTSQIRNMTTGMAGLVGAFAAAGATIATGGAAAVAVGAAAAVGIGAGALANTANTGAIEAQHEDRERRAQAGLLVLAVRVTATDHADNVMEILRQAGATRVEPVERTDSEVTAASWTG